MNLRDILFELDALPKIATVRLNGEIVTDLTRVGILYGVHEIQVGESTVYTVEVDRGVTFFDE
jgi:predicted methyltransferase